MITKCGIQTDVRSKRLTENFSWGWVKCLYPALRIHWGAPRASHRSPQGYQINMPLASICGLLTCSLCEAACYPLELQTTSTNHSWAWKSCHQWNTSLGTDLFALGRWKTTAKKTTEQKRNRCYGCENVEENDIRQIILLCQSCIV